MEFFKYEAAGNDFIILDGSSAPSSPAPETVRRLCDRHTGVGADGVILLLPSTTADLRMRIINADGGDAQMCGNGLRALVLFAYDAGFLPGGPEQDREVSVETASGIRVVTFVGVSTGSSRFKVDMGEPSWTRGSIPIEGSPTQPAVGIPLSVDGSTELSVTCISMGNPHCVLFVDDVAGYPVTFVGPAIENNPFFPQRTNVEFVQVADEERLLVRVWERGVGETLACGTGACAALVATRLNGLTGPSARVSLPGGVLDIQWDGSVFMTGPARRVFTGRTVEADEVF